MVSERWVKKYMRMAKQFGEDDNRCYSRQIGVVLVNPVANRVISTGLNGPPRDTPPCDDQEYLEKVVVPRLTFGECCHALEKLGVPDEEWGTSSLVKAAAGCGSCPRKLIGVKSGQRSELCSCQHAERNAISNAGCDLTGAWAFCWCGVPCDQCTGALINAGIEKVYCIEQPDYSYSSRFLFEKRGVELVIHKDEYYLEESPKKMALLAGFGIPSGA